MAGVQRPWQPCEQSCGPTEKINLYGSLLRGKSRVQGDPKLAEVYVYVHRIITVSYCGNSRSFLFPSPAFQSPVRNEEKVSGGPQEP